MDCQHRSDTDAGLESSPRHLHGALGIVTKKALIVGVSGQDGAYLAQLLLSKGYEVVGTSRDVHLARLDNLSQLGIRDQTAIQSMSPTEFRSVVEVLSKFMPDEVYNLAGQSSVALSFEQPVDTVNSIINATVTLLEVIRFLGKPIRLYNAGSSECFGVVAGDIADETTPFRPRSPYGAAKAAAHFMVANYREGYGLYGCTGILFNHESPLRPERFVTRKIAAAAARISIGEQSKLMLGNMSIRRDWGWGPDYVDAMWRMLQQERPQDLVIATGKLATLQDFVAAAFGAVGLDWQSYVNIDPALRRPTDLQGFAGDFRRAKEQLGWAPTVLMPDIATRMVQSELETMDKRNNPPLRAAEISS
jgi:GDPmannose 4,6-dehydratase